MIYVKVKKHVRTEEILCEIRCWNGWLSWISKIDQDCNDGRKERLWVRAKIFSALEAFIAGAKCQRGEFSSADEIGAIGKSSWGRRGASGLFLFGGPGVCEASCMLLRF
jgi:hypothetical protein